MHNRRLCENNWASRYMEMWIGFLSNNNRFDLIYTIFDKR